MKRTVSLMLTMVLLFSILVGCNNNGASDISSDLSEVTSSSTEQVDSNFETTEVESTTTESGIQEENSTVSNSETTNTTTKPSANSNNSQTTKPNTNSTTSNTTTKPSTSNSTTGNNNSSSSNTNNSTVEDNYVYRNPTVYVDGMYRLGERPKGDVYMGDVYADLQIVSKMQSYRNWTLNEKIEFDAKHIVTDVNKMPSNYKYYTYIVDTIPNWLYEKGIGASNYIYPAKLCTFVYESYSQYAEEVTWLYRGIGDIDYKSVTADNIRMEAADAFYDPYNNRPIDMDKLTKYVNYVKENKIKLTTIAEPLLPIVYCKGDYIFIRTKITVNVESSETDNIKLFLHEGIKLSKGENVIYLDIPMAFSDILGNSFTAKIIYGDLSQYVIS